ncbi:MAG: tetratricopeptide repeat protein [Candidatus Obscuribacterales bacterium]|nr:tetratricopeptide repeat protein [Candidatus Obscuribacterales bacterium]
MVRVVSVLIIIMLAWLVSACSDSRAAKTSTTNATSRQSGSGASDNLGTLFTQSPKDTGEELIKKYLPGMKNKKTISAQQYLSGAMKAFDDRDYDGANWLINESIKRDKTNGRAYYMRGWARSSTIDGNYDEALQDFEKSISLGYQIPDTYEFMARIYDSKGKPDKAIETLTKGLELPDPNAKKLYRSRGSLYLSIGKNREARKDYDRAIEVSPDSPTLLLIRAQLLESMNELELAEKDYKNAARPENDIGKIPKRVFAMKSRAAIMSKLGRHDEAIADLNSALSIEPNDDELLRLKADQYAILKKYKEALSDYSASIDAAPDFAHASYTGRARVYEILKKSDLAKKDRQAANALKAKPAEKPLFQIR